MITAKATTPADILEMQGHELAPVKVQWEKLDHKNAITGWQGDRMIGIGGINWYWKGVGEAWLVLHENANTAKLGTFRAVKAMLEALLRHCDWWRIEAVVRDDWPKAQKFAEKLGFTKESTLRKYCDNGDDAYMYAMVKE